MKRVGVIAIVTVSLAYPLRVQAATSDVIDAQSPAGLPSGPIELLDVQSGRPGKETIERQVPFSYGTRLDNPTLYRLLGRDDLARTYEGRHQAKTALLLSLVATLAATAGSIYMGTRSCPPVTDDSPPCTTFAGRAWALVSLGGFISFHVLFFTSTRLDPDPISREVKQRLVDEYNAKIGAPASRPTGAGRRSPDGPLPVLTL